jgi:hypothetical protein
VGLGSGLGSGLWIWVRLCGSNWYRVRRWGLGSVDGDLGQELGTWVQERWTEETRQGSTS